MQDHYRDAVEVIGALHTRRTAHNKLNRIASHTADARLEGLVRDVLRAFDSTQTNSLAIPISDMTACKEASTRLLAYCRQRIASPP